MSIDLFCIKRQLIEELGETEKEIHLIRLRTDAGTALAFQEGKKEGLKTALDYLNRA